MMIQEGADVQLEQALNSFDPNTRRAALADLMHRDIHALSISKATPPDEA